MFLIIIILLFIIALKIHNKIASYILTTIILCFFAYQFTYLLSNLTLIGYTYLDTYYSVFTTGPLFYLGVLPLTILLVYYLYTLISKALLEMAIILNIEHQEISYNSLIFISVLMIILYLLTAIITSKDFNGAFLFSIINTLFFCIIISISIKYKKEIPGDTRLHIYKPLEWYKKIESLRKTNNK